MNLLDCFFSQAAIGFAILNQDQTFAAFNMAFSDIVFHSQRREAAFDALRLSVQEEADLRPVWAGKSPAYRLEKSYGHYHVLLSFSRLEVGGCPYLAVSCDDLTGLKIEPIDDLTGLAARRTFFDALGQHIATADDYAGESFSILLIDLNNFKRINDSFGHQAGDLALLTIAHRLKAVTRGGDCCCRLGGDEFALLLPGADFATTADVCRRLVPAIESPIEWEGKIFRVEAAIGAHIWEPGDDVKTCIGKADRAMFSAKSRKVTGSAFRFSQSILSRSGSTPAMRLSLFADDIHSDNLGHQLRLHYQPIVRLTDMAVVGYEALARWAIQGQLLSPAQFLPQIAEAGIQYLLDAQILKKAAREVFANTPPDIFLGVNAAVGSLIKGDNLYQSALSVHAANPERLIYLEITESSWLASQAEEERAIEILEKLRLANFFCSVDDLGEGFSSTILRRLPTVRKIKLDRSLVQSFDDPVEQAFCIFAKRLAEQLNLMVVAEGIETTKHLRAMQALRCQWGQGYLFGKPQPPEDLWGR